MPEPALQAPLSGKEVEDPTISLSDSEAAENSASDDRSALDNSYNKTVRMLADAPKVMVRVPAGGLYVQINGWKNFYAEGRYEVPQPVADIWIECERI